jgi:hypothetical protein
MIIVGANGVKPMIYINKFGELKMVDESDDSSSDITEQTIEIVDDWKSLS